MDAVDIGNCFHKMAVDIEIICYEEVRNMLNKMLEKFEADRVLTKEEVSGYEYAQLVVEQMIEKAKGDKENEQDGQRKEDLGSADQGDQEPLRSSRADGEPDGGKQPESIL